MSFNLNRPEWIFNKNQVIQAPYKKHFSMCLESGLGSDEDNCR